MDYFEYDGSLFRRKSDSAPTERWKGYGWVLCTGVDAVSEEEFTKMREIPADQAAAMTGSEL